MFVELISLLAIVVAIIIGFWKDINVGLIALVFAFLIGYFLGNIPVNTIIGFWPMRLFFTTFGVTLLFSVAKLNGTLEKLTRYIIYQSGGRKSLSPILFYLLAFGIASIGPGNISTSALLLPIGLVIAAKMNISILLMSGLIILGSIAGGLSPLAPNGIVALELASSSGVGELGAGIYLTGIVAITLFCILMYVVLGGLKLNGTRIEVEKPEGFHRVQIITLISMFTLVLWVIIGGVNVGFAALTLAVILLLFKAADQNMAISAVPWSTLILICGTAVLIGVSNEMGGILLLTNFLGNLMTESSAIPILTALSGIMSIFSSAVGVVMPTLIPTTVALSGELGDVFSPALLTTTIAVGSHITTTSPFSTMGALALASAPENFNRKKLFRDLFILSFAALAFVSIFGWLGGFGLFL